MRACAAPMQMGELVHQLAGATVERDAALEASDVAHAEAEAMRLEAQQKLLLMSPGGWAAVGQKRV